ncbi:MAG: hypothetical protein U9Q74_01385, partial [Gemmatimonadota bacterium]|nr:hypothetical protein [Gemmatimonadota bacterium]
MFGSVSSVIERADGSLLIHDVRDRRVLIVPRDRGSPATVILDATERTAFAYHSRAGNLIAARGDSALFIDPDALAGVVIDAHDRVAGAFALPPRLVPCLLGGAVGMPAVDAADRVVCRQPPAVTNIGGTDTAGPLWRIADSAALVAFDLRTRRIDTVTFLRTVRTRFVTAPDDRCQTLYTVPLINPLPIVDEWAMLRDGTIAVVRGEDYHVDWYQSGGAPMTSPPLRSSPRFPSDSSKVAFVDSTRQALLRIR